MTDARTSYRENAVRGATPVGLVLLLYEQIIQDLRRAVKAIEQQHIENRTRAINHAIVVIGHLQSKLNKQAGGDVAQNLERFYDVLRATLLEAQISASKNILEKQIDLVLSLRDAWREVERENSSAAGPTPATGLPQAPPLTKGSVNWRA